jgi:hypothetical protein
VERIGHSRHCHPASRAIKSPCMVSSAFPAKMLACPLHIDRVSYGGPLKVGEYIMDCALPLRHVRFPNVPQCRFLARGGRRRRAHVFQVIALSPLAFTRLRSFTDGLLTALPLAHNVLAD